MQLAQRVQLREEQDEGGAGIIARYQSTLSDTRTAIRTLNPELDARLVLWEVNRISSTRSESADRILARLERQYGLDRDEVRLTP